jgi:hypothetical protein
MPDPLDQPIDPHASMDLYEALERQKRGTLPELPPLSAADAIRSLLEHDRNGWGWRLSPEGRIDLVLILQWLERRKP